MEGLRSPCCLGGPQRFRAGGQNWKWPTSGRNGYETRGVWGVPNAAEQGGKIRHALQVGGLAKYLLPSRRSPTLQSGGQNQNWPTSGRKGCVTPAFGGGGGGSASDWGTKSLVDHKWAESLQNPCRLGGAQRFRAGAKIRSGPQVGLVATYPMPSGGSPTLQSGGQNEHWRNGYGTPAIWGVPNALEWGTKSEVAHKCAWWLHNPRSPGVPNPLARGTKSEVAHKWAEWLCKSYRLGSATLQNTGQNQKWLTSGPCGYITPAV